MAAARNSKANAANEVPPPRELWELTDAGFDIPPRPLLSPLFEHPALGLLPSLRPQLPKLRRAMLITAGIRRKAGGHPAQRKLQIIREGLQRIRRIKPIVPNHAEREAAEFVLLDLASTILRAMVEEPISTPGSRTALQGEAWVTAEAALIAALAKFPAESNGDGAAVHFFATTMLRRSKIHGQRYGSLSAW